MKKTLTIVDIEAIKNGVNKSGPWTLYSVHDSEGKKYSTFLDDLESGETGTFEIEETKSGMNPKTGKPYKNFTITGRAIGDETVNEDRASSPSEDFEKKSLAALRLIYKELMEVKKIVTENVYVGTLAREEKKDEEELPNL